MAAAQAPLGAQRAEGRETVATPLQVRPAWAEVPQRPNLAVSVGMRLRFEQKHKSAPLNWDDGTCLRVLPRRAPTSWGCGMTLTGTPRAETLDDIRRRERQPRIQARRDGLFVPARDMAVAAACDIPQCPLGPIRILRQRRSAVRPVRLARRHLLDLLRLSSPRCPGHPDRVAPPIRAAGPAQLPGVPELRLPEPRRSRLLRVLLSVPHRIRMARTAQHHAVRCPYAARRTDRARVGQPAHAAGRAAEGVLRRQRRLTHRVPATDLRPYLNPQEGIWSLVKRDIGNLAAADLGQVTRAVKRKLKMLQ